jgi:hypothetical protein
MNIAAKITSLTGANKISIGENVYRSLDHKVQREFMSYPYLITDGNILTMGLINLTKFIH